jgi:hypothetical protein
MSKTGAIKQEPVLKLQGKFMKLRVQNYGNALCVDALESIQHCRDY